MSPETPSLSDELPLFQLIDFDIFLNQSVPIGIDSAYPSELRVRLSAASISYQRGNKSVDHVIKRYFNDLKYDQLPGDRLDKRISESLKLELRKLDEVLGELAPEQSVLGQMVSKWTFMRIPFSFDLAITCAQRGALFECLAIVRMILEQVAWSLEICDLDDFNAITSRQTYQSIGGLKSIHPAAGKFYGWLSGHAHWTYDAHIKAFEAKIGTITMRLANSLYKAQALGAILVLFAITQRAYCQLITSLGSIAPRNDTLSKETLPFLRELQSLAPRDEDIGLLVEMIKTEQ
jgi:hypothetical protein